MLLKNQTWDIAFQRFYIRTNSGTSGEGQGGALDTKETAFDKVTVVPTSGFIADTKLDMMTIMGKFEERSANTAFQVLDRPVWAWFDAPTGDMQWHYNKNVFIIKTADGKHYAKINNETIQKQMTVKNPATSNSTMYIRLNNIS